MHNKPIRRVRKTALIYCEGAHDLAFIRHIKKLYAKNSAAKMHFVTRRGSGGSPVTLIEEVNKTSDSFDRILVKLDNDRGTNEHQKAVKLQKDNMQLCWSNPCIDALLLLILNPDKSYTRYNSTACKRMFEGSYIAAAKRSNSAIYDRLFTKAKLETARESIKELDQIIKFFES